MLRVERCVAGSLLLQERRRALDVGQEKRRCVRSEAFSRRRLRYVTASSASTRRRRTQHRAEARKLLFGERIRVVTVASQIAAAMTAMEIPVDTRTAGSLVGGRAANKDAERDHSSTPSAETDQPSRRHAAERARRRAVSRRAPGHPLGDFRTAGPAHRRTPARGVVDPDWHRRLSDSSSIRCFLNSL